jgi:hypothetical protein
LRAGVGPDRRIKSIVVLLPETLARATEVDVILHLRRTSARRSVSPEEEFPIGNHADLFGRRA